MQFCGIRVQSQFFLAPMAAITNLPFRLMCKKQGAGLVITEQINATQIARNPNPFTNNEFFTIKTTPEEKPVGVQLFGTVEKDFIAAVDAVEKNFELININCGCPSHKEVSIGAGAALLKDPAKIAGIIRAIKGTTTKPVTAKIRLGWNSNDSAAIAREIERAGADAIMVHGRTAQQGYSGTADWQAIRNVQETVEIPVVANGDVNSGAGAAQMLEATGCEFGMVGRAAMTNPLIFREINTYLAEGLEWKPAAQEKIACFFDYFECCKKFGMTKVPDIKLKAIQLTKGIDFTKQARVKIQDARTIEGVVSVLGNFQQFMEEKSQAAADAQAKEPMKLAE